MARSKWHQLAVSSNRSRSTRRRPRLAIDTLEARIVPAPTPLTYVSPGAASLTLKLSGADLQIVNAANTVVASKALVDTSGVVITGANAATESLTVDFDNGGFFALTDGVQFNAGTGGTDALSIRGTTSSNVVLTPSASGATAVVTQGGSNTITATGLEAAVAVTNLATLTVRTSAGADVLTLDNQTTGVGRVSGTTGGITFRPVTFTNVPTVTVDAGTNDSTGVADAVTL